MAQHDLGIPVDFQGGGMDLVFPHHYAQNEIALTLEGTPFARGFMHTGFVRDGGLKMSKSTGNLVPLGPAVRQHGAAALRWYLLGHPYADPIDWSERELERSHEEFVEVRRAIRHSLVAGAGGSVSASRTAAFAGEVEDAIGMDLGVDRALDRVRRWAEHVGRLAQPHAASGERAAVRDAYARVERLTGLRLLGPP
jgi:cysteinyl-tRNA synthetase